MPDISVADVLVDPDFVDTTPVLHTVVQRVNESGMLVEEAREPQPFDAVITVDHAVQQQPQPDGTRVKSAIRVHTTTPIYVTEPVEEQAVDGTRIAGRVEWNGYVYTVESVDDYSAYGALYVAHCTVRQVS